MEDIPGWDKMPDREKALKKEKEEYDNRKILVNSVTVRKRCHRYTLLFLFCAAHALVSLFSVLLQR